LELLVSKSNYGGNPIEGVLLEGFGVIGRREQRFYAGILAIVVFAAPVLVRAQAPAATPSGTYQPKFAGDPAHSESEAEALGYMRVVLRAQRIYEKRHSKYATSLAELAGTGSFTKRMASTTDRGDYTASFRPHKEKGKDEEGFVLTMTPKQMDADHRSFYAEEDGVIHADDQKAADEDSPKIH
jgi:hypothetical protein